MTERQLSKAVVQLAEMLGWRCYVIQNTRAAGLRSHTGPGWPDVFAVKGGRALAVELKVRGRKPTQAQLDWLRELGMVPGVESYLWTEMSWQDGTVESVLRGGIE